MFSPRASNDWLEQHRTRIGKVVNWICLSNFLLNRDWYLLAMMHKWMENLGESFEVFCKHSFFICLILIQLWKNVCCLLFQRWIQLKDEIFDDLLDQTNCAITPWFFVCFYFALFFARKPLFLVISSVCMRISYYKLCDEAEGNKLGKNVVRYYHSRKY
jgi:hypothetical protein